MRTNVVMNDELVEEAFRYAGVRTKRELVDLALREFVESRKRRDVRELRGRFGLYLDYDHKALREGIAWEGSGQVLYLVDTSIWIGYLRERESEAVARFSDVLDLGLPFGITGVIYGEVLQGARTPTDFERLKEYTSTQRFYHLRDPIAGYEEAARLYYRCRRSGVTVRSIIDCLIARRHRARCCSAT